jgi:hypothetical protein
LGVSIEHSSINILINDWVILRCRASARFVKAGAASWGRPLALGGFSNTIWGAVSGAGRKDIYTCLEPHVTQYTISSQEPTDDYVCTKKGILAVPRKGRLIQYSTQGSLRMADTVEPPYEPETKYLCNKYGYFVELARHGNVSAGNHFLNTFHTASEHCGDERSRFLRSQIIKGLEHVL